MLEYVLLGGLVVVLYLKMFRKNSPLDVIPGPKPLPVLGNALQLNMTKFFITLDDLRKQHGGIFRLYLFTKPVVVVSDEQLMQDVLIKHSADFAGRPYTYRGKVLSENLLGIAMMDEGPEHKGRRKVLHSYLKQFGSGIKKLEEVTRTATDELVRRLADKSGEPIKIQDYLFDCVTDVIVILLTGDTVRPRETEELKEALTKGFTSSYQGSGMILDMFPFVRFLGNKRYQELLEVVEIKDRIVSRWLESKPAEGFINFLQSMTEAEQKQNFLHSFSDQSKTVFEFLGGGVFTTFATLTCLMNVLCHYPDVQEKLRREIFNVIGTSRHPTMSDRELMPYMRATILEIGRFASVTPIAIPHKSVRACSLSNYTIPKDTQVMVNLWGLHHDENLWDEPFKFKPERFLDADGHLVKADHVTRKRVLSFGAGHRVCVGEVFAVSRMFLIVSRILQNFIILPESTVDNQPSCDPRDMTMGIALKPVPFKVRILPVP